MGRSGYPARMSGSRRGAALPRRVPAWTLVLALAALFAVWPAAASAAVYWGVFDGSFKSASATVGAANLDGGGVNRTYLKGLEAPGSTGAACGVSVSDSYLYWAGAEGIGRVNLDGAATPATIVPNLHRPCGLTVDESHVYWGNSSEGSLGRANLDGTEASSSFITGLDRPCDIAVGAGHVYWMQTQGIGRANLDGSNPEPDFLPLGVHRGCGIAIRGQYLYWGQYEAIARANLDGTERDPTFIADTGGVEGIATDAGHIYWVDMAPGGAAGIGRAELDGGEPERAWIPPDPNGFVGGGQSNVLGVAVDARPSPPPLLLSASLSFGRVTHFPRSGRASVEVWVPRWGDLQVSAPGLACRVIAGSVSDPSGSGPLRWRVRVRPLNGPVGKRIRAKLKRKGAVTVTLTASFNAQRTPPATATKSLRLLERKPVRRGSKRG